MRKLKQVKMYAFNNKDITTIENITKTSEHFIVKNDAELKAAEVTLTENLLIHAYCTYTRINLENNMLIKDIIKVTLNSKFDTAKSQCKNGIRVNGELYDFWFATVASMKKEDAETNSKCECFFIKTGMKKRYNQVHKFDKWFEYIISLGNIENLDVIYAKDEGKLCLNKDILSRLSLTTSSAYMTSIEPKIVVLPECCNKIISDIVTINKADKLEERTNETIETTPFDGCGVMSKELANRIKEDLKVEQDVSFAIIRGYMGLAIKGLVTSIDFNQYFQEFYTKDTEYFYKKEDNKFYCIDYFGQEQCLSDADLILNTTMVKWAKWWKAQGKNMDYVYAELNREEFAEYKHLLSKLWITKINKADEDLKTHTLTNYQLLSNIATTPAEIDTLSKETERVLQEILDGNEDATSLFLGDIVTQESLDEDGELVIEENDSITTQAQALVKINPEFLKLAYVKRTIAKLINKKIKLLASGKFYIAGDCKVFAQDPISYLDWIMNRTGEEMVHKINGLEAHKFYCSDINAGEIRTLSRNPLNSFSEVQNIKFDRNNTLDKYLNHLSREILVFNCYDLICQILSGADFDGDIGLVADEEIIKNSVVTDLPLINLEDGAKGESTTFTVNNRINSTLKASGNAIGKLADLGIGLCNLAQETNYKLMRICKKEGKCYGKTFNMIEVRTEYFDRFKNKTFEDFTKFVEEQFGEPIEITEKELKQQIKDGFFKYRKASYKLRFLQQTAIDAPKTLKILNPKDIPNYCKSKKKDSKEKKDKIKKARFQFYAKDTIKKKDTENTNTALNLHATRIARTLINKDIENKEAKDRLDILQKYLTCTEEALLKEDLYKECKQEILDLKELYTDTVSKSAYNLKIRDLNLIRKNKIATAEEKYNRIKASNTDTEKKKAYAILQNTKKEAWDEHIEAKQEAIKTLLAQKQQAEIECMFIADKIEEKFDKELVCNALVSINARENFIFSNFFIPVFTVLQERSKEIKKIKYIEDKAGNIDYLFKKYKKIEQQNCVINAKELADKTKESTLAAMVSKTGGFKHEIAFYNKNGVDLSAIDKVIIKQGNEFNGQANTDIVTQDGEIIGYVLPDKVKIDDFRTLRSYFDTTVNFKLIEESAKGRVKATLIYV